MLEQINNDHAADLKSVYRYLAQRKKDTPFTEEIMSPPMSSGTEVIADEKPPTSETPLISGEKASLRDLFEIHAAQERSRVERLIGADELMKLSLKFQNRKGQILSGKIWLVSSDFKTVHLIDEADPLKTSYPMTFEELRSLNPDFAPQLLILDDL